MTTSFVETQCENRVDEPYKSNRVLKNGWIHLGINREEFIPPYLRVQGMKVGMRVSNLLFKIQQQADDVASMVDATSFFTATGLNQRGREFREHALPYFIYATNLIQPRYVNNPDVWNRFVEQFLSRLSGGEEEWTGV